MSEYCSSQSYYFHESQEFRHSFFKTYLTQIKENTIKTADIVTNVWSWSLFNNVNATNYIHLQTLIETWRNSLNMKSTHLINTCTISSSIATSRIFTHIFFMAISPACSKWEYTMHNKTRFRRHLLWIHEFHTKQYYINE